MALDKLMQGSSHRVAAETARISVRTLCNWVHRNDAFRREYVRQMKAQRDAFEHRAVLLGQNSVAVVDDVMRHPAQPHADTRLKAANAGLSAAVRLASRYKELQLEGHVPPPPMIIFPANFRPPWLNRELLPVTPGTAKDDVVEGELVEDRQEEN